MESIGAQTAKSLGVELASMETVFALCAILLLGFNLLGIVLAGWRLTRRDAENDLVRQKPPVSLVVPLRGEDSPGTGSDPEHHRRSRSHNW